MMDPCAPYLAILLAWAAPDYDARAETCADIVSAADEAGESVALMVQLAYVESRFSWPDNGDGPLQARRKYWPGDRIHAGIVAWQYYRMRCRAKWGKGCTLADIRCAYNMGWSGYITTGVRGCEYAERFRGKK